MSHSNMEKQKNENEFYKFTKDLYKYFLVLEKKKSKISSSYKRIFKTFNRLIYNFSNIKKYVNHLIYENRLKNTNSTKGLNITLRNVLKQILFESMSIIGSNCYIDNIPQNTTEEQLYHTFSFFGPIGMLIKPTDTTCLIWFLENKHAKKCSVKCHKMMCEDRIINVYDIQPKKKCIDMEFDWKTKNQTLYFKPDYMNIKIPTKIICDWWIKSYKKS